MWYCGPSGFPHACQELRLLRHGVYVWQGIARATSPGAVEDTKRETIWKYAMWSPCHTLHLWQDFGTVVTFVMSPVICSLPGTYLAGKGKLV